MTADKQSSVILSQLETAKSTISELEGFVASFQDDYLNVEAWSVFHVWLDREPNPSAPYFSAFRCWQLFHWHPDPPTVPFPLTSSCRTIAESCLKLHPEKFNNEQKVMIASAIRAFPDLYEVSGFGESRVYLKAIIGQRKVEVFPDKDLMQGKMGEYIFAHAIPAQDDVHILLGRSHFLPRSSKQQIAKFSKFVDQCGKPTQEEFQSLQSDLFNLLYDLKSKAL